VPGLAYEFVILKQEGINLQQLCTTIF